VGALDCTEVVLLASPHPQSPPSACFQESIMSSESDWSQHQKLIDFSSKPFRRSMVPNLPYFMVQWDYKGEKGYGHVIEGEEGEEDEDDHKMKNGNQAFPG